MRSPRSIPLALLFSLSSLTLFGAIAHASFAPITSSIAANTSWGLPGSGSTVEANVFWIQNSISVNPGVTLTMGPGIIVKFSQYTTLTVNGALQGNGTGAQTIYITSIKDDARGGDTNGDGSTLPAPSDWGGITFSSLSPDSSRLFFCDVAYGGYYQRGMLTFANGVSGRLTNCTLRNSWSGVDCQGTAAPLLVDTSIQTSSLAPIMLDFASLPTLNRLTFSFHDNGFDALLMKGGTVGSVVTLPKRAATVGATPYNNVTYVLYGGLTINPGAGLTISPGVVIKPTSGSGIYVYGNLTMNGTAVDTITVTSINDDNFGQPPDTNNNGSITAPNRNDWNQIYFYAGGTGSMQYSRIKFGTNGLGSGMVEVVDLNLSISHSLLSDAAHGLMIHGTTSPILDNVAINNMQSTPTLMSVNANPTFTNVTFLANGITALGIIGEVVSVNAHLTQRTVAGFANITYYVMTSGLDMQPSTVLTLDAGVVLKFYGGSGVIIRGTLTANGTVGSPIVFTSERDDQWGNPPDTNGDGQGTTPAQGNWYYVQFTPTANAASVMNYCRVQYGSAGPFDGYPTSVWIQNCSPTLSHCNIYKGYYGMRLDGNAAPTIGTADTVTNCVSAPVVMSVQSNPTITLPYFKTNGMNALALESETLTLNGAIRYRPNVTFQLPDPPTVYAYVTTGQITVPNPLTLTIDPQVVIKISGGNPALEIGGAINAVGSGGGGNRVIFTSYRDDVNGGDSNADQSSSSPLTGDWGTAIQFDPSASSAQCVLRNCLFTFGGNGPNSAAVVVNGMNPTLERLDFLFNRSAVTFRGITTALLDSTSVLNCTSIPIAFSLLGDPRFAHMTVSGNTYNLLGILGETVTQDVHLVNRTLGPGIQTNISYTPTGDITIGSGAKWTINPGIVIKLGRYAYDPTGTTFNIDGALIANGKPDSLIVFTSMADDAFGGDNNSDGAASPAGPQQWGGINFSAISNSAATVINNVRLRFGAFFGTYLMSFTNTSPTISNTTFTSGYEGVHIAGNSAPVFNNVFIDSCGWMPVRMSLVSNPTFNNVTFQKNYLTGLGLINETIAQDLLWKIRAISGRLNMPYLIDGALGIGLGSTVTLQPGLIVKFKAGNGGQVSINRAFVAEGRTVPESLIVFTSSRDDFYGGRSDSSAFTTPPATGDWAYMTVLNTAIAGQVRYRDCVIRYGGSGPSFGAVRAFSSSPTLDSCVIAYNQTGVSVEGAGNPVIHGCSLYGNLYNAVTNTGTSFCTDATGCWWGAASGPNDANAAADVCGASKTNAGTGDAVTNNVNYTGFATSGILSPLLGDVSLNGQVLAYDASLILQYLVPSITFSPLQKLVADVDNNGSIQAMDASLILQLVVGSLQALPGNRTGASHVPPEVLAAREVVARSHGTFQVELGDATRQGDEWLVPVSVTGTAPIYAVELKLEGGAAASIGGVDVAGGALDAFGAPEGAAKLVLAAAQPIPQGVIATLHFPAGAAAWSAPRVTWARVNTDELPLTGPTPVPPTLSFLAPPAPNPATGPVRFSLGVSAGDAGRHAKVEALDLAGRRVRTLFDGALPAGVRVLTWDLGDSRGHPVPAGVYLVREELGGLFATHRMIVIR